MKHYDYNAKLRQIEAAMTAGDAVTVLREVEYLLDANGPRLELRLLQVQGYNMQKNLQAAQHVLDKLWKEFLGNQTVATHLMQNLMMRGEPAAALAIINDLTYPLSTSVQQGALEGACMLDDYTQIRYWLGQKLPPEADDYQRDRWEIFCAKAMAQTGGHPEAIILRLNRLHAEVLKEMQHSGVDGMFLSAYMQWLLAWATYYQTTKPLPAPAEDTRWVTLLGDSHTLTYGHQMVMLDDVQHRVRPRLLNEPLVWNVLREGSYGPLPTQIDLRRILASVPDGGHVGWCVGEVDCRIHRGVWAAARKAGVAGPVKARQLAEDYVAKVAALCAPRGLRPLLVGVPTPVIRETWLSDAEWADFDATVAAFNDGLREGCAKQGWKLWDVGAVTAARTDPAVQALYLDYRHLSPAVLPLVVGAGG